MLLKKWEYAEIYPREAALVKANYV